MASIIAKKEKAHRMPIFAVFFILFGACLLAISLNEIRVYTYKNDHYINTEAKVIKHTYENGKTKETVLEYTIGENRYIVKSNNKIDIIKSYGSTILIKYNPNNPEEIIFTNRSINIVIPILAIIILSTGLSITIVMISDNIKRIKRITKIIKDKEKIKNNERNNISINNINNTNIINDDKNHNINIKNELNNINNNSINTNNNIIKNIDTISKEEETNTIKENKNEIKNDQIIDLPFVSNEQIDLNNINKNNNTDYIDFISEINDNNIPDFIPNIDSIRKNNK